MKSIRILLADSDLVFRAALAELLGQQGYQMDLAANTDETREQLGKSWYHMVILNMQLRNHNDPNDMSGLEILREEAFQPVPKFVIANHPTVAMTREALRPGPSGVSMAIDFFGKDSDVESLLAPLQDAIKKHVRVNWALKVRYKEGLSFLQFAQIIEPTLSNSQVAERADELESLFRDALHSIRQITFERILSHRLGYVALELTAHGTDMETLIVACSKAKSSDVDRKIPTDIDNLDWQYSHSSVHFTIQIYRLRYKEPLRTFREAFTVYSIDAVIDGLSSLTTQYFAQWHQYQRGFEPPTQLEPFIRNHLEIRLDFLESTIAGICKTALAKGVGQIIHNTHDISLYFSEDEAFTFYNPASVIGLRSLTIPLSPITYGLTHGRINGSTILLDAAGQAWLIDRSRVNIAPILLDYVALELAIRLEGMSGIDLVDRFYFEQLLDSEDRQGIDELPIQFTKAFQAIQHVRQIAKIDPIAYSMGLFYSALAQLSTYQTEVEYAPTELTTFVHLLLLTGILSKRLIAVTPIPQQALESLWINPDNNEVWVEGHTVELTPQDLAILIYLYKNAHQRRSREQIIDEALGEHVDDPVIEESRLNSAMSRLRLKIEPNPEKPKYLLTIRGYGYRLNV